MAYKARRLSSNILSALKNHPVVFLNGPRQAGKTTLVRNLADGDYPADYVSFDSPAQMAAASVFPEGFLNERKAPVIIDEVQMVPDLFRVLKSVVDERRRRDKAHSNGRFLLTGSANVMALPELSEALVGRMAVKTLYPFAAHEVTGGRGDFPERLFAADFATPQSDCSLNQAIAAATFPDISGKGANVRADWFDGYLTTLLQRDVRMLAELDKIVLLPILLRILATRAGSLVNDADVARDIGLNPVTTKSYRRILQAMFLEFEIPPWYRNISKRLVKSSKAYLTDSLLLCHLLDWRINDLKARKSELYGHVVENFVATEILKLLSFSDTRASFYHFRTSDNKEVDFVLERPDGTLAGIEVKVSERIDAGDFSGMRVLQAATGDDFICGVALYAGREIVPFGDRLYAVPLTALWG